MRRYAIFAAAMGMAVTSAAVRADFIISDTSAAGTGQYAGDTVYQFFALNTGTNDQAGTHTVESISLTMTDATGANLVYRAVDNGDGTSTADFDGTAGLTPLGSYIRAGLASKWFTVSTLPVNTAPNPTFTDFGKIKSFQVTGLANFAAGGQPASTGAGAQIGQAVVPTGDVVTVQGNLAAEAGPTETVSFSTAPVPEPASIGMLGLGLGALMMRRRKA